MEKKELLSPKLTSEKSTENSNFPHDLIILMYDIVHQARSMSGRTSDQHLKKKHKAIEETFLLRIEEITRSRENKEV